MARELSRGQIWQFRFTAPDKRRPVLILRCLTLHRARAERRFSGRDRAVLAALVCALSARIGVKLATCQHRGRHDLPTRQRQVLDSLLVGESEKQIADRLGIGIGTAHAYVKALYRYYGAHSRGELLAYQLRRTLSRPVKKSGRRSQHPAGAISDQLSAIKVRTVVP